MELMLHLTTPGPTVVMTSTTLATTLSPIYKTMSLPYLYHELYKYTYFTTQCYTLHRLDKSIARMCCSGPVDDGIKTPCQGAPQFTCSQASVPSMGWKTLVFTLAPPLWWKVIVSTSGSCIQLPCGGDSSHTTWFFVTGDNQTKQLGTPEASIGLRCGTLKHKGSSLVSHPSSFRGRLHGAQKGKQAIPQSSRIACGNFQVFLTWTKQ